MSFIQGLLTKFSKPSFVASGKTERPRVAPVYLTPGPLLDLFEQRQRLEVYFEGSQRSYQTLILSIDDENGVIWFDDLFPSQRLLETGSQLEFIYRSREKQLKFTATVIATGEHLGIHGFAITFPHNPVWHSRRQYRRLNLFGASALSGKLRAFNDDVRYGTIENLSAGGMCILLAGSLEDFFQPGEELPLCEFMLNDIRIQARARVRGLSPNRTPYRSTRLRLEFLALSEEKRAVIDDFINRNSSVKNFRQRAA